MAHDRWMISRRLVAAGSVLLGLGILLLLVKLTVLIAWNGAGAVALVGLVLLVVGWAIGGGRR
jgi:hypothetical protein